MDPDYLKALEEEARQESRRSGESTRSPYGLWIGGGATEHELDRMRAVNLQLSARRLEALALYRPTKFQDRFHRCKAKECAVIAGNQTGKSLAAFVEDARAVTNQDPYNKYPQEGVLVCLGLDEKHIGMVIHKYLFRAGAFQMLRDEQTGEWRSWMPWLEADMARKAECKPAPPLIPNRFVKNIAWEKRGQNIFKIAELNTGWIIYAMSSKGEPAGGFQADMVHIDEDIEREDWYDEMLARLTMRDGKIRWSALPLDKNDALSNLEERAEDESRESPEPSTVVVRATVFDNPYMPESARRENIKRWKSQGDEVYRQRALGERTFDSTLMYPSFHKDTHGAIRRDLLNEPEEVIFADKTASKVQKIITHRKGVPPPEWTKYYVVDPGHSVCAVLFFAVPHEETGDQLVCYDELYIHQCDAIKFGSHMRHKCMDNVFQAGIIDEHGGRLRGIAGGLLPKQQYAEQLRKHGISTEETGSSFRPGCDDVQSREMKLREWLSIRSNGTPALLVVVERCPNLVREFGRFKKKIINGYVQDEGNRRKNCHAVECAEYAAADGLPYVKPKRTRVKKTAVDYIIESRRAREEQRKANRRMRFGSPIINLGPQGA